MSEKGLETAIMERNNMKHIEFIGVMTMDDYIKMYCKVNYEFYKYNHSILVYKLDKYYILICGQCKEYERSYYERHENTTHFVFLVGHKRQLYKPSLYCIQVDGNFIDKLDHSILTKNVNKGLDIILKSVLCLLKIGDALFDFIRVDIGR